MITRPLPRTDLEPSEICLGTAEMGGGGIDDATSSAILDRYLELGGNVIDTARIYSDWIPGARHRSETFLGRWLQERRVRDKIILSTKGAHPELATMEVPRMSRADVSQDLEKSLQTLGVDHVDLYWLHRDDPQTPVEEILLMLDGFRQAGKIRYAGFSNWELPRARAALDAARKLGLTGFVAGQNCWNLAEPDRAKGDPTWAYVDQPFIEWHRTHQFTAIPYSTQANGYFRRMEKGTIDQASELVRKLYHSKTNQRRFANLQALASELHQPIGRLVLAYLLAFDFPVLPLIGPRNVADLE
ncbi:MAG TPA: aldo/keto reductase, partial [Chthoniobacterales bacterium]